MYTKLDFFLRFLSYKTFYSLHRVSSKNENCINNYVFIKNEIALLYHSTFILFCFYLYCTQNMKSQRRRNIKFVKLMWIIITLLITVNENFIEYTVSFFRDTLYGWDKIKRIKDFQDCCHILYFLNEHFLTLFWEWLSHSWLSKK